MKTFSLFLCAAMCSVLVSAQISPTGSWQYKDGSTTHVLLFHDSYFTHSIFDVGGKQFIRSFGGPFRINAATMTVDVEFDTQSKDSVGRSFTYPFSMSGEVMNFNAGTGVMAWQRVDRGNVNLAGNWRITGRMEGGTLQQMQRGDRKTLKLLTADRFQWFAINPKTKEFFGTGGGTYTFKDGKYTETIEFFSRDNSRVGASLSFDGKLEGNNWYHSGKSSKGDPISEVWTREK